MAPIFYEEDLQSGIGFALRESKSVVCFIRDDGDESSKWEDEYLEDAQVKAALTDRAITLRILAGSREAGFLSAYYPVQTVPALMIIHNGLLTLDLKSGQDKAAFKAGVLTTLIAASSRASLQITAPSTETVPTSTAENLTSPPSIQEHHTIDSDNQTLTQHYDSLEEQPASAPVHVQSSNGTTDTVPREDTTSSTPSSSNQQSVIHRLLDERRQKLEVDKKRKEEAEKADRKAKEEARKESISVAPNSAKAKQATFAQEQRKRNVEARLERERVLRQIEQDKIDRKEREERRKALAKAEAHGEIDEDMNVIEYQGNGHNLLADKDHSKRETPRLKDCAVQVRLFDGSTIRSRFSTGQILFNVREWVDEERSDDFPFTFKQILSPSPNRSLTISEEQESLMQLGFAPSATLVMVPIKSYTAAYTDSGPGIVSRIASIPYNAVAAGAGLVSGALGTVLGFGQATPQQGGPPAPTSDAVLSDSQFNNPETGINVRTLYDQRREQDDHQLYNGNHINVEPRNDDPDKDK